MEQRTWKHSTSGIELHRQQVLWNHREHRCRWDGHCLTDDGELREQLSVDLDLEEWQLAEASEVQ